MVKYNMKKLNVLIIEDESIISIHLKKSVMALGYNVVAIARDSNEVLKIIENSKVDIALVDINLAGDIDGIQIATILSTTYNIPLIFITAFKDKETLKRASNIDFAGYIIKPFREDELEVTLNLTVLKYNLAQETNIIKITNKYTYNFEEQQLYIYGKTIKLTQKESTLLSLLVNAKGSVVVYEDIDSIVWNYSIVSDDSRRQLFRRLKSKLQDFPFELVKGIGYRIKL